MASGQKTRRHCRRLHWTLNHELGLLGWFIADGTGSGSGNGSNFVHSEITSPWNTTHAVENGVSVNGLPVEAVLTGSVSTTYELDESHCVQLS